MSYLITGATGFIGSQFLSLLGDTQTKVYALVRPSSKAKLLKLAGEFGLSEGQLVVIEGDLSSPLCGVDETTRNVLKDEVEGFYHFGALYDITANAELQKTANIEGTQNAIALAESVNAKCFHHISSVVAAGFYNGTFTEDMFDEAVAVERNPYFETKHIAEGLVRHECKIPWRIYRPGIVVGHSETGWITKVDGPYYFFQLIEKLAELIPRWIPLPILKGNTLNIVPVDFVANAIHAIAQKPELDGQCFHLTDPAPMSFGEVINEFLRAAKGPSMSLNIPLERLLDFLPAGAKAFSQNKAIVARVKQQFAENLGIPKQVLLSEELSTQYDCTNTLNALEGTGISVPSITDYANRLWLYWDQNLNKKYTRPQYLRDVVKGKRVLITGGSEGIGKQVAINCANAGAEVILVARSEDKLNAAVAEIQAMGGEAYGYTCDISDLPACDNLINKIFNEHGFIDILVNNAGRSIRRSLNLTYDRFHDFERVMQINYLAAVRLSMNVLPSMEEKQRGHIINISSIAALGKGSPRFSSYMASKSAMDAWANSAGLEFANKNIHFTNVHMPLVRTGMIEATKSYKNVDALSPEQAALMIDEAIVTRKQEINTVTGNALRQLGILAPDIYKLVFTTLYQLTDDSAAAKESAKVSGDTKAPISVADKAIDALKQLQLDSQTLEGIAQLLKGYHT